MTSEIRHAEGGRYPARRSRFGSARTALLLALALCIGIGAPSAIVVWSHGGHATPEHLALHQRELARGNLDHHPDAQRSSTERSQATEASAMVEQTLEHASGRTRHADAEDPCVRDVILGIAVPAMAQVRTGDLGSIVPLDVLKLLLAALGSAALPETSSRLGTIPRPSIDQRFVTPLDPPPILS